MSNRRNAQAFKPKRHTDVLIKLSEAPDGKATRAELGVSGYIIRQLREDRAIKQVGSQKNTDENGKPIAGHPSPIYALAANGRKRVNRALDKQQVAA